MHRMHLAQHTKERGPLLNRCTAVRAAVSLGCQVGLAQLEHALHAEAPAHAQRRLGFGEGEGEGEG